jgi:DNA-binding IclR family transcriptional regulator
MSLIRNVSAAMSGCELLTSHGYVLLCIARNPGMRLREIAQCVGITERAVQRIVCDLCEAGYLSRRREGRQNAYEIHPDAPLAHELVSRSRLGDLLGALAQPAPAA